MLLDKADDTRSKSVLKIHHSVIPVNHKDSNALVVAITGSLGTHVNDYSGSDVQCLVLSVLSLVILTLYFPFPYFPFF